MEDFKQLKEEISHVLKVAKFELRKWKFNVEEIRKHHYEDGNLVNLGEATKILGLRWDAGTDTFHFTM